MHSPMFGVGDNALTTKIRCSGGGGVGGADDRNTSGYVRARSHMDALRVRCISPLLCIWETRMHTQRLRTSMYIRIRICKHAAAHTRTCSVRITPGERMRARARVNVVSSLWIINIATAHTTSGHKATGKPHLEETCAPIYNPSACRTEALVHLLSTLLRRTKEGRWRARASRVHSL